MTSGLQRHLQVAAFVLVFGGATILGTQVKAQNGTVVPLMLAASTELQSMTGQGANATAGPVVGGGMAIAVMGPGLPASAPATGLDATPPDGAAVRGPVGAWSAVAPHLLDDMRGGFDTSMQLRLSFGIERAVYLNGALVTTTSFNLPALSGMGHDDGAATVVPVSSIALIQNGPGNVFFASPSGAPLAATVVQNSLSNQTIQSLTTINASANSLGLLRAHAFQGMVRDGIGQTLVPH